MLTFSAKLCQKLIGSLYDSFEDNYDVCRFGPLQKKSLLGWARQSLKQAFRSIGLYREEDVFNPQNLRELQAWMPHFADLDWLHKELADDQSRDLLVDVVSYRIMGHRHVRLPLSSTKITHEETQIPKLPLGTEKIMDSTGGFTLMLRDLTAFGAPFRLFMPEQSDPATTLQQYACHRLGIEARTDDVVIDGGACWGDTALYFADKIGPKGRVFSFEFVPENMAIFRRNLDLNPELAQRIELVPHPLWGTSGVLMKNEGVGPGAKVNPQADSLSSTWPASCSIDDLVQDRGLQRVDMIKMDIEGAEFEALQGARLTLARFKPDLALCVYHSREDFTRLAKFVESLKLGYRFALDHFTIHAEETVLYATAR